MGVKVTKKVPADFTRQGLHTSCSKRSRFKRPNSKVGQLSDQVVKSLDQVVQPIKLLNQGPINVANQALLDSGI